MGYGKFCFNADALTPAWRGHRTLRLLLGTRRSTRPGSGFPRFRGNSRRAASRRASPFYRQAAIQRRCSCRWSCSRRLLRRWEDRQSDLQVWRRLSSRWHGRDANESGELAKGLEPDGCFYILNHHRVCHRRRIDLAVDPPPDLAVETEISRSVVPRLRIYAALGVPEIWRWRKNGLTAYSLGAEGKYVEREFSLNLPMLRVKDLEPFLDFELAADETAWIRNFRDWVRERFLREKA
ncbi:MAG: hypothetical protein B7Z73_03655 [Planctomycetia bacterium 21-64-5]|nr:MAG: hypothetical protein B7Z73_03655 [Planctomycetia bacterium 21-64-5]